MSSVLVLEHTFCDHCLLYNAHDCLPYTDCGERTGTVTSSTDFFLDAVKGDIG